MQQKTAVFSAPAKVNLALRVVGKRFDGYYLLQTVMTFFPIFDYLEITVAADLHDISLSCQPVVTTTTEDNLVFKAATALRLAAKVKAGAAIKLTKNIPHGGGLGGGSSDAATLLLALNKMWEINWPLPQLIEFGVKLGADIPIFLGGHGALAEGIGERLTVLPNLPTAELVLLNPGQAISTAKVFAALADRFPSHDLQLNPAQLDEGCLPFLLENDLQPIVREMTPIIDKMAAALLDVGAQSTLMSGSGSSMFGLFTKKDSAQKAVTTLKQRYPDWKIVSGSTFNIHPFANEWKSSKVPAS